MARITENNDIRITESGATRESEGTSLSSLSSSSVNSTSSSNSSISNSSSSSSISFSLSSSSSSFSLSSSSSSISLSLSSSSKSSSSTSFSSSSVSCGGLSIVNSQYPYFSWNNSVDLDGDTITYQLQIAPRADWASPNTITESNIPEDISGITTHQIVSPLSDGVQYVWRVRGWDGLEFGEWSETQCVVYTFSSSSSSSSTSSSSTSPSSSSISSSSTSLSSSSSASSISKSSSSSYSFSSSFSSSSFSLSSSSSSSSISLSSSSSFSSSSSSLSSSSSSTSLSSSSSSSSISSSISSSSSSSSISLSSSSSFSLSSSSSSISQSSSSSLSISSSSSATCYNGYRVGNAGTIELRGEYYPYDLETYNGRYLYTKTDNVNYKIFYSTEGSGFWIISNNGIVPANEAIYYHTSDDLFPPLTGWTVLDGDSPAPWLASINSCESSSSSSSSSSISHSSSSSSSSSSISFSSSLSSISLSSSSSFSLSSSSSYSSSSFSLSSSSSYSSSSSSTSYSSSSSSISLTTDADDLESEITVLLSDESDIGAEIKIVTYGYNDLDSTIYIIEYEDLPCDITILGEGNEDLSVDIVISYPDSEDISAEINVATYDYENIYSTIYIIDYEDLSVDIFIPGRSELKAEILIDHSMDLPVEINIPPGSSIDAEIVTMVLGGENLDAEISIDHSSDLLVDIYVIGSKDLATQITILTDLQEIPAEITVVKEGELDLPVVIFVVGTIKAEITILQADTEDLDAELTVVIYDTEDLDANLFIYPRKELDAEITIMVIGENDLSAEIIIAESKPTDVVIEAWRRYTEPSSSSSMSFSSSSLSFSSMSYSSSSTSYSSLTNSSSSLSSSSSSISSLSLSSSLTSSSSTSISSTQLKILIPENTWQEQSEITFTWTEATDEFFNIVYYAAWNNIEDYEVTGADQLLGDVLRTDKDCHYAGHWYLHVRASNSVGHFAEHTSHRNVDFNQIPSKPFAPFLVEGLSSGAVISTVAPTFKWTNALDPDQLDVLEYHLQIALDTQFNVMVVDSNNIIQGLTSYTDYTLPLIDSLPSEGIYYWRVSANDSKQEGEWSITNVFEIIPTFSNLTATINIPLLTHNDIKSDIYIIPYRDIDADIFIYDEQYKTLPATITIVAVGDKDLSAELFIAPRAEIGGEIYIISYNDLEVEITVIDVPGDKDLSATITIIEYSEVDISAKINISLGDDSDLNAEVYIVSERDLPAEITIFTPTEDLLAEIFVSRYDYLDLPVEITTIESTPGPLTLFCNVDEGIWQEEKDIEFTWLPASSGLFPVIGYLLHLDHISGTQVTHSHQLISDLQKNYDLENIDSADSYWFHIAAVDSIGHIGPVTHFNVKYNHVPSIPGLPMLINNLDSFGSVPIIGLQEEQLFDWGESIDPDTLDRVTYDIQISDVLDFTNVLRNITDIPHHNHLMGIGELISSGHYYWRVRATDGREYSNWGDIGQFVVNTPPTIPNTLTVAGI